jgi:hypothetical protein
MHEFFQASLTALTLLPLTATADLEITSTVMVLAGG